jgi:hypothetical protein
LQDKDAMKKKRRVELQIEHREISFFARTGGLMTQAALPTGPEVSGLRCVKPNACPTCGSGDLLLLADTIASTGIDLGALQLGVETGKVHVHRSVSSEWWVCLRSLHHG